jgi:hypothetical protein
VERGLDERGFRHGARDAVGLVGRARSLDPHLGDPRHAFSVAHQLPRELARGASERVAERVVVRAFASDLGRPGGPARERDRAVVRRGVAVHRDAIEAVSHGAHERAAQQRRRDARVGREEREHGREVRSDHARALGHPADLAADAASGEADRHLLGPRVGGHDRARGVGAVRRARGDARPRRSRRTLSIGRRTPMTPVEATTTSSRRSDGRARRARHLARVGRPRSPVPAFAQPALITIAARAPSARCSREITRARLREVGVKMPAAAQGRRRPRARGRAGRLDPGGDARGAEAERGGDAHFRRASRPAERR